MSNKTDIKAALAALQFKEPLRLLGRAPTFQAPSAPITLTSGDSPSQDAKPSRDSNASPDQRQPEDVHPSLDTNLSKDQKQSLDENQPMDTDSPLDPTSSQDESAPKDPAPSAENVVARASQPRRATEQDRAVTEISAVRDRLSTGYTRVPNSILMRMVGGDLSRSEIKIALLIARMTISFNRPMVPLSKGVIERMTGVQGRAVLEALKNLELAGIVRKTAGSHKQPNRLGLIFDENFGVKPTPDENPPKDLKSTQIQDQKSSQRWGEKSSYKKDTQKNKQKHLSPATIKIAEEGLRVYFDELKPVKKRESEWHLFQELRTDYSEANISECLKLVQRQNIHSPMAYIAKAMGGVLLEVQRDREKILSAAHQDRTRADRLARDIEIAESDEREREAREKAFEQSFSDEEQKLTVIHELCAGMPFKADSAIGRNFAIGRWYGEWSRNKRTEQ